MQPHKHKYPVARLARSTMLYTLVGMFFLMLIPVFLAYSLILIHAKPIFPRWAGAQFKQYGRSIWCVALFLLAPILTRLSWHSVWVVYPGTKREKNTFICVSPAQAQEWIMKVIMAVQPLTPISFYKGPGEPYSLVLCTLSTSEELRNRRPDKLGAMVSWLTSTYHQWPTSMNPRSDRLVKGADATTFMVMENVLQVQERHKTDPLTKNIVIVGAGFIGSQVANKCAEMGLDVRALDIRMNAKEKLDDRVNFYHEDVESAVKDAHLIVLLTMVGDVGVTGLMQYIESGTVIISDTHPKISKEMIYRLNTVGVTVYESALVREGVKFFPKLPKWNHDTVPGCVGEALVRAALPPFQYDGSHDFTWNARRVLKARLDDGMGLCASTQMLQL